MRKGCEWLVSRENEMIDFLSELKKDEQREEDRNKIINSTDNKFRAIDKEREKAREVCLDTLLTKVYKNSIPMDDNEKNMPYQDLDKEFKDFIKLRSPKGTSYYVQEAIKKGSKPAKALMESVNYLLKDVFGNYALNINETSVDEISFDVQDPEIEQKLEDISGNMEFDELSEVIQHNVKVAANEEINRVKEERQKIKELEDSLKEDESVTNESAIERQMVLRGYKDPNSKLYQPTLFEGIMINKLNLIKESGIDLDPLVSNQLAFSESVKEYTKISVLKAFNLDNFNTQNTKRMAMNYATMKESGEIDMLREDRIEMYEQMITEGANLDARARFKEFKKEYSELCKKAKKYVKEEKYDEAIKLLQDAKKLTRKTYDDMINKDPSTLGSALIGTITGIFPFLIRNIISVLLAMPTLGISVWVNSFEQLIQKLRVISKDANNEKVDATESLNSYKRALKTKVLECEWVIDEAIKKIKKRKSYNK